MRRAIFLIGFAFLFILTLLRFSFASTVNLRLHSMSLVLNPFRMADIESRRIGSLLYLGLVTVNQDGSIGQAIAENWQQNGNTWTFHIKENVLFTNGQPVRSKDIISSLCETINSSPYAWSLSSIQHQKAQDGSIKCTGLVAVDDRTVRIVEDEAVPWLINALGTLPGWTIPAGEISEGPYGIMAGVGPYLVEEVVPGNKVILVKRKVGTPIEPGADRIVFHYVPDDSVAARLYEGGDLDILDLNTPYLLERFTTKGHDGLNVKEKISGQLNTGECDRVRVVIINKESLLKKGFDSKQAQEFIHVFSAKIDRNVIADRSKGLGKPLLGPFPPVPDITQPKVTEEVLFPRANLTVITEADPWSDLIAASLPPRIGNVKIDYQGMEKGVLINSLIQKSFDIASLLIEDPVHAPVFWKAFFEPANPLSVFGVPIKGLDKIDIRNPEDLQRIAHKISAEGNWVSLLKEKRLQLQRVEGVRFTPSGQVSYERISKK